MKGWLVETVIKTFGPSAIRGAILGVSGWLLAKENILAPFGIVSDAIAKTTTIHWEQMSAAVVIALPALIAGVVKMTQKEAQKVIQPKGETPQ